MHLIDNSDAQSRPNGAPPGLYGPSRSCHSNRVCRSSGRLELSRSSVVGGEDIVTEISSTEDISPGTLGILDEEECCSETTSCLSMEIDRGENLDHDGVLTGFGSPNDPPRTPEAESMSFEEMFRDQANMESKELSRGPSSDSVQHQNLIQSYGRSSTNNNEDQKNLRDTLERALTTNAKWGSSSRKSISRRGSLIQATLTGIRNLLGDHTTSKATQATQATAATGAKTEQSVHTTSPSPSPLRRHSLAAAAVSEKNEGTTGECESAVAQLADFLESRKQLAALAAQLHKCPTHPSPLNSGDKHLLGGDLLGLGLNSQANSAHKSPSVRSFLPRPAMQTPNRRASCAIIPTLHRSPLSGSSYSPSKPMPATISPERERTLSRTPPYAKHGTYNQSYTRTRQCRPNPTHNEITSPLTNKLKCDVRLDQWCPTPTPGSQRRASVATMMCEDSSLRGTGEVCTPRIKPIPREEKHHSHVDTGNCSRAPARFAIIDSFSQTHVCLLDDKSTQTEITRLERLDRGTQTIDVESTLVSRGCSTLERIY